MPEQIVVKITGDTAGLNSAMGSAGKSVGGLGGGITSLLSPAMLGAAGAAVVVAGAIVSMTAAAAADRDEQAKLATAIEASGAATGNWTAQVDDAIAKGQALAFTDSDIRAALIPLTQATGDMESANALLATSQDVARLAGVDLETASKAVAKAHEGQAGSLTRLIPALANVEEGTDLVAEAQRLASGQADTFAKSTEGQLSKSSIAFDELQETIGSAFLPILDEIIPALTPIVELLGELIKAVLPVVISFIKDFAKVLRVAVTVIRIIASAIGKLVDMIKDLIKPITDALGGLRDLVNIKLPSFDLPDLPHLWSSGGGGGSSSGGAQPRGITINTGADPQSVVRHVRAWVSANGSL